MTQYKTKFKNLVVSGCSFTHEPNDQWYPFSWASMLAKNTGMKIFNHAIPGAGNNHIAKSIILFLEKNKLLPEETFVLPMWSHPCRIDFITDRELSNFKNSYPLTYDYDNCNELVLGGNWWNIGNPTTVQQMLIKYSKFQSNESLALNSWLNMNYLSSYLTAKRYTYFYTSYISYNYRYQNNNEAVLFDYINVLKKIGLELNKSEWIDFDDDDYYGDYCARNNFCDTDGFHPKYPEAQEGWVSQILIPHLIKLGILYE
jgi:hypothetical protein